MGIPHTSQARRFYRCAIQRYEESKVLRREGMTTGSVYLAGYANECMLKALLLDSVPSSKHDEVLFSFHGQHAHNYDWLRSQYRKRGHSSIPHYINRCFLLIDEWSTDLRYNPRGVNTTDADVFLSATETLLDWAKERF